jgi:MerR family redox-sensitive transcriptional activator SoxR
MSFIDISEAAKRSGFAASALRFYEERGLITSVGRRGLRRLYELTVLERLSLIALGQAAGFSLDDIAQMFGADGRLNIDRARLREKAADLDRTIQRLQAMSEGLKHAANCRAPSHLECPTFRRIVHLATADRLRGGSESVARSNRRRAKSKV